jgi:hypothetical protein
MVRRAFSGLSTDRLCASADAAQANPARARSTTRRLSDERMLEGLRLLLLARGLLNEDIIDEAEDLPCTATYKKRFGGLGRAYELTGYTDRPAQRRRDGFMVGNVRKLPTRFTPHGARH